MRVCQDYMPWSSEIEYTLFRPKSLGLGPTNEAVFYHKRSKTLLVTDTVISVSTVPPDIIPASTLLASSVSAEHVCT
jgi:Domain of unknown function (DUF4336)